MGSDGWLDLLNGTSGADAAGPLVKAAGQELDHRIEADPELEARIVAILHRTLGGSIDQESLVTAQNALATYLGDNIAFLFGWVSEPSAMPNRLDIVDEHASKRAATLVRSVVAQCWRELRDAQDFAGQSPNEWKSLSQEAFLDQITEKYTVRLRIVKYSGETVVLESAPNSALGLVKFVTRALTTIASAGVFDTTNLQEFFSDVDDLRSRAAADTDPVWASGAAAGTTRAAVTGEPQVPELVD